MKRYILPVALMAMVCGRAYAGGSHFGAGLKVPLGTGFFILHNGDTNVSIFSQFGIGGFLQAKYKVIGLEMDFMYERDGDIGESYSTQGGTGGGVEVELFKLNIYPKLIAGGFYLGVGPEFAWNGGWDGDVFLSLLLGYNIELAEVINITIDFFKTSISFWEDHWKYFDIQVRLGVGINLF